MNPLLLLDKQQAWFTTTRRLNLIWTSEKRGGPV
jgi:hypothetical protein